MRPICTLVSKRPDHLLIATARHAQRPHQRCRVYAKMGEMPRIGHRDIHVWLVHQRLHTPLLDVSSQNVGTNCCTGGLRITWVCIT